MRAEVVAFQGELGAYSHEALEARFGEAATPLPCRIFQEVADRVISGEAALGRVVDGAIRLDVLGGVSARGGARGRSRGKNMGRPNLRRPREWTAPEQLRSRG